MQFNSTTHLCGVESLTARYSIPIRREERWRIRIAPRCNVILTVERNKIPPDIMVLEMTGRIVMGNNSRDVELKLAEVLRENAKKIIFDLKGVSTRDSTRLGILVVCNGKITKAVGELAVDVAIA